MEKKKVTKKPPVKKAVEAKPRYLFAIGRRKTALAKIKLVPLGTGEFTINGRAFSDYFPSLDLQKSATDPLSVTGLLKKVNLTVQAVGGGINAQAKATALGISRALIEADPNLRTVLKKQGFLRRDARKKERKKPGLKRARRAPQWQKR